MNGCWWMDMNRWRDDGDGGLCWRQQGGWLALRDIPGAHVIRVYFLSLHEMTE